MAPALAAAALAGAVAVTVLAFGGTGPPVEFRLALLLIISALPITLALVGRLGDPLSPISLMGVVFLASYALRGFALLNHHSPVDGVNYRAASAYGTYFSVTVNLVIGALIAFYAGYGLMIGQVVGQALPGPRLRVGAREASTTGLILVIVGGAAFAVTALQNSGYLVLGGALRAVFGEPLRNVAALPLVGLVVLAWGRQQTTTSSERRVRGYQLAGGAIFIIALSFLSGERRTAIWTLLTLAAAWHFSGHRLKVRHIAISATLLAFVFFPAMTVLRRIEGGAGAPSLTAAVGQIPTRIKQQNIASGEDRPGPLTVDTYVSESWSALTRRMYGIDSLMISQLLTPSVYPYADGSTLKRAPASFIPRAIWHNKPSLSLAGDFGNRYWGRPSTADKSTQAMSFLGELYINFGRLGIFIGMFLLGVLYRAWYAWLRAHWNIAYAALYVVALPYILSVESDIVLELRTALNRIVVAAIGVSIAAAFTRRRQQAPTPTAS
jgi:hypothetical protein